MSGSRYPASDPSDYSHRLHAGNVGDVWKHCVLVAVLRRAVAGGGRVAYVETHAGEGGYTLHQTGEWTEGVGRLWAETPSDPTLADYVALCRRLGAAAEGPYRYPGSPVFARAVLGADAELALWERDADAAARLSTHVGAGSATQVVAGDGLAALDEALRAAAARADAVVALIDPSWGRKSDWQSIPDALAGAARSAPSATLVLWYPVKSLTRPNAMVDRLAAAGVDGAVAELITTPLDYKRNRLNGSGVILVRPPAGTLEAVAAAAPGIGARCATFPGQWSLRLRAFAGTHGIC